MAEGGSRSKASMAKRPRMMDQVESGEMDVEEVDILEINKVCEPVAGIIVSMKLTNFMCHGNLTINFNKNSTYIIGRNGSGKSAIMMALMLGLGGKATSTSRAPSAKSFVKNGCYTAEIEIVLHNQGAESYKTREYGSRISITRKLKRDGTSAYLIKNLDTGAIIGTKHTNVLDFVQHFHIQIDNPVTMLTQDVSRTFLNSRSPKMLYELFFKATGLSQVMSLLMQFKERNAVCAEHLKSGLKAQEGLKKEKDQWEKQLKMHENLNGLKEKLLRFRAELIWSVVGQIELELEEKVKESKRVEDCEPSYKRKVDEAKEAIKVLTNEKKQGEKKVELLTQEMTEAKEKADSLKELVRTKGARFQELAKQNKIHMREIENLEGSKRLLVESIAKANEEDDYDKEVEDRRRQSGDLKSKIDAIQEKLNDIDRKTNDVMKTCAEKQEEAESIRGEVASIDNQIRKLEERVGNAANASKNKLRAFGNHIPPLVQAIDAAHAQGKFRKKPMGPLGSYISVKDQQWSLAVEECLGGLIHEFICDNEADKQVLLKVMNDAIRDGRKPGVIVSKYLTYPLDVTRGRVNSREYATVFDMIEVSDHQAMNMLIDHARVECRLLIPTAEEASRMSQHRTVPKNAHDAYLPNGDHVFLKDVKTLGCRNRQARFLVKSFDAEVDRLKQEIDNLKGRKAALNQNLKEAMAADNNAKRQKNAMFAEKGKLRKDLLPFTAALTKLENTPMPERTDVSVLQQELEDIEARIQELKDNAPFSEEHKKLQGEVNELKRQCEQAATDLAFIEDNKVDPAKDELGEVLRRLEKAKDEKKHYDNKMAELEQKIKNYKDAEEAVRERLTIAVASATAKHPDRVHTRRKPTSIESEIQTLEKHMTKGSKGLGSLEMVTEKYNEALEKYVVQCKSVDDQLKLNQMMEKNMEIRKTNYELLVKWTSFRTKHSFTASLGVRDFDGKLKLDHDKRTLEMKMEDRSNVANLSGGEKSFAMVSFIIALWHVSESPFRVLDEYSVFMDNVNMKMATDCLMQVASSNRARQYVFLSPLEMPDLVEKDNLTILRLNDPRDDLGGPGASSAD